MLRALPAVSQRFPNVRYVIVGDGPDRKRVEALSRELRVEESIIFAGYVPNEELAGHYNLCDVFVMASKGEGFGIVFLEALSCGKPVIAGNKDASVEAVLGGKLGMLVDPDDVGAIADAIVAVIGGRTTEVGGRRGDAAGTAATTGEGAQTAEVGGRRTEDEEDAAGTAATTAINSTELRREVIAAYGFEQFRLRIGEIVRKMEDGRWKMEDGRWVIGDRR